MHVDATGVTEDIPAPSRWRRFLPGWLRALLWTDDAARYDAFLSYSWGADKEVAPMVQATLQRFLRPWYRVRAKNIFRDLSCIPAGSDLYAELRERIDRSDHFIVLASPEAAASRGMDFEARHWFSKPRSGEVVIIVTAGQYESWDQVRETAIPVAVRDALTTEPVWASIGDRRQEILGGAGSKTIIDQLVEDLTQVLVRLHGVDWGTLRGIERSNRRRAITLLAGGASVLLVLATVAVWQSYGQFRERRLSQSREYAARAQLALGTDGAAGLSLAIRALDFAETPEAERVLSEAMTFGASRVLWKAEKELVGVAASPDGRLVAAGTKTGFVRVFDARSGSERFAFEHGARATLAFSPDSRLLASVGGAYTRVWDVSLGSHVMADSSLADPSFAVFSRDGRSILSFGFGNASLRRVSDHSLLWSTSLDQPVSSAEFSPDGTRIVVARDAKHSGIWKAANGAVVCEFDAPDYAPDSTPTLLRLFKEDTDMPGIFGATYHPTEARVLTAGEDGVARLWSATSCQEVVRLQGHQGMVNAAVFSPDGRRMLTTSDDGRAAIWALEEGDGSVLMGENNPFLAVYAQDRRPVSKAAIRQLIGHIQDVEFAAFSSDGTRAVTAGFDQTIRVWNTDTGDLVTFIRAHTDRITGIVVVGDDRIASTARDGTLRISEMRSIRDQTAVTVRASRGTVSTIVLAPDGQAAAIGWTDGAFVVADVSTGAVLQPLLGPTPSKSADSASAMYTEEPGIRYASFSRDGDRLAAAGPDGLVRIWNRREKGSAPVVLTHESGAYLAELSPTGDVIVTAEDEGGEVRVWESATGKLIQTVTGQVGYPIFAGAGSGGLLTISNRKDDQGLPISAKVTRWDIQQPGKHCSFAVNPEARSIEELPGTQDVLITARMGLEVCSPCRSHACSPLRFPGNFNYVLRDVAVSPDGKRVVGGGVHGFLAIWDLDQRKISLELQNKTDPVTAVAYSHDGRSIASISGGCIMLWSAQTGQQLQRICAHRFLDIEFGPDDHYLVAAAEDGAFVYALRASDLRTRAARIAKWMRVSDAVP